MIALSCVENFARLLGEADFAAVERLEADPGRLVALGIDMGDVRDVQRRFLLDDAAGLAHGGAGTSAYPLCTPPRGAAVLFPGAHPLAPLFPSPVRAPSPLLSLPSPF